MTHLTFAMNRTALKLPLAGVKVLDLSRLFPGPFCSMILADFGADVLCIEYRPEVFDRLGVVYNPPKSHVSESGEPRPLSSLRNQRNHVPYRRYRRAA